MGLKGYPCWTHLGIGIRMFTKSDLSRNGDQRVFQVGFIQVSGPKGLLGQTGQRIESEQGKTQCLCPVVYRQSEDSESRPAGHGCWYRMCWATRLRKIVKHSSLYDKSHVEHWHCFIRVKTGLIALIRNASRARYKCMFMQRDYSLVVSLGKDTGELMEQFPHQKKWSASPLTLNVRVMSQLALCIFNFFVHLQKWRHLLKRRRKMVTSDHNMVACLPKK